MAELSKAEKLLVAAGRLAGGGQDEFTAEDLVVRAYREFPNDFSMKGHPEYPDSNPVLTQVMGKKAPLIVRGWLVKTGTKKYRLTQKGLDDLIEIGAVEGVHASVKLERKSEDELAKLLTSTAFRLFREHKQAEITFYQFCRFAGLSARDKWQKVAGKLNSLEHLVEKAVSMGEAGQTISLYMANHNEQVMPDDLRLLGGLLGYLKTRFKGEMDEWKGHAME